MTVLLKDALKPNIMQTLEGNACLVHAGPFANIAQGNNSIIADKVAMKLADYVVTESGFAADLGSEKFMDIICRYGGFAPSAVVITCTMRALKMHGGLPVDPELLKGENNAALEKGCENLAKQVENMKYFGIPVVVTINRFAFDRDSEVEIVRKAAVAAGAEDAVPISVHALGGDGGQEAAEVVKAAADRGGDFKFLYPLEASIKEKIETIATKIYGADGVDYLPTAEEQIKLFTEQGLDKLPLCMAKTHLSLSHDPTLKGRPRGFRVPIREVRPATGAGYLYPLLGEMRTMPGLSKRPAAVDVDIDTETGRIIGLF
jgi:formate--tetrahydrofolate ligase